MVLLLIVVGTDWTKLDNQVLLEIIEIKYQLYKLNGQINKIQCLRYFVNKRKPYGVAGIMLREHIRIAHNAPPQVIDYFFFHSKYTMLLLYICVCV